jgi:hypothetical protein
MKCGRHEIGWTNVSKAHGFMEEHFYRCCRDLHDNLSTGDLSAVDTFHFSVTSLTESWSAYQGGDRPDGLIATLAKYHSRQSSDPRYKVYGLLSL